MTNRIDWQRLRLAAERASQPPVDVEPEDARAWIDDGKYLLDFIEHQKRVEATRHPRKATPEEIRAAADIVLTPEMEGRWKNPNQAYRALAEQIKRGTGKSISPRSVARLVGPAFDPFFPPKARSSRTKKSSG
jgi:hypothetical protein